MARPLASSLESMLCNPAAVCSREILRVRYSRLLQEPLPPAPSTSGSLWSRCFRAQPSADQVRGRHHEPSADLRGTPLASLGGPRLILLAPAGSVATCWPPLPLTARGRARHMKSASALISRPSGSVTPRGSDLALCGISLLSALTLEQLLQSFSVALQRENFIGRSCGASPLPLLPLLTFPSLLCTLWLLARTQALLPSLHPCSSASPACARRCPVNCPPPLLSPLIVAGFAGVLLVVVGLSVWFVSLTRRAGRACALICCLIFTGSRHVFFPTGFWPCLHRKPTYRSSPMAYKPEKGYILLLSLGVHVNLGDWESYVWKTRRLRKRKHAQQYESL